MTEEHADEGQADPSATDSAPREAPTSVDLSEGARGIVVMPTQNLAPVAPDDFPSGLPSEPQNMAPSGNGDAPTPAPGDDGE